MNRVKKGLDNQAIGLLPLLLFMFLDNYFSYLFLQCLFLAAGAGIFSVLFVFFCFRC